MSTSGFPCFATRESIVRAKRELLGETARQYAHGCASEYDLARAAIDYARAVNTPLAKSALDDRTRKGRTG